MIGFRMGGERNGRPWLGTTRAMGHIATAGRVGAGRVSVVALLAILATAGDGRAADLAPAPVVQAQAAPLWHFQATAYGWLTAVTGDVGVRNLPPSPVDASILDVLDHLDGALMGTFLASDGRWLFLADLVLAKLTDDQQVGSRGLGSLGSELSQTIATGTIGYWLPLGIPALDLAVTGGLRYVHLSAGVSLGLAGQPLALSGRQGASWYDPTVGLAAHWAISDLWFLNATADIGGFGVGSKLSSNGYVGVGYMWTPSVSTALGYRYLYEDYERNSSSGSFRYNATMHGPTVSLAWHF
ncbi:hypothetical protein V5F53_02605 [Xanthobacter sp. V4C-4]|uniref:hypothetical protein n=1 Tax=Xanthobacter cornucopiae TaxID=3119924 RepID=UPI0037298671